MAAASAVRRSQRPRLVLAPFQAREIGRTVLAEEEARGGGKLQEVLVERRRERRLLLEDERSRAPDDGDVLIAEADEFRQLPDEARHVGAGQVGRVRRHGCSRVARQGPPVKPPPAGVSTRAHRARSCTRAGCPTHSSTLSHQTR